MTSTGKVKRAELQRLDPTWAAAAPSAPPSGSAGAQPAPSPGPTLEGGGARDPPQVRACVDATLRALLGEQHEGLHAPLQLSSVNALQLSQVGPVIMITNYVQQGLIGCLYQFYEPQMRTD